MAMTEQQKATGALQRAALFGLIDPFAQAVRLNWPGKSFLLEGRYGTWRAHQDSLTLNMVPKGCGDFYIRPLGYWSWNYTSTTEKPVYSYYRTSDGRRDERQRQGKSGPLPEDLFSRTWVLLRNGLANYVKATNLALPPAYTSILFPTA